MKKQYKRSVTHLSIAVVLGAVLLLVGCSRKVAAPPPVVTVQTALAIQKPIEQIVSADAVLFPVNEAAITPKITAPAQKFFVQRGDRVRRGELLAVLENRDIAAAAVESQGAYEQAQAAYESTTGANLPEEIQKAELNVKSTHEVLDAARKLYQSRKYLYEQGALPRKDLDQAQVDYVQARSQSEMAQKHLSALLSVGKQQQLKAAAGQLTAAKGKYEGAQAQLAYTEIRSPIAGVVADRPLYPGETASAGTPLITVMNTSEVIARAHIPEDQAALLKVGAPATLSAPGLNSSIRGEVTVVSPAADPNSTTIEVWVKVKNPNNQLRPGTTAQVSIVARRVADATVIPAAALLKSENGRESVMTVGPDRKAHEQEVQAGIQEASEIQILSGLKPGERVITKGAYGLPDRTQVEWNTASVSVEPYDGAHP